MTLLKTAAQVLTVLLFILAALGYAFFQPFEPDAVRNPIPAEAAFVCRVKNLNELLPSPVGFQLSEALGSRSALRELVCDRPETARWIKLTAPSEIAVAHFPSPDTQTPETWLAVTWIGWRSPWLRWRLNRLNEADGLVRLASPSHWPTWQVKTPVLPKNIKLTCALTDKLFIACLSGNTSDIRYVLDTYDKRYDSVRTIQKETLR